MTDRIYPFTSIYNFRDFGNYKAVDNRNIHKGKLFRSAHLNGANAADLETIESLGIKLVVDLRHKPERAKQPNKWPEVQSPTVLEYPDLPTVKEDSLAPHEMFVRKDLFHPDDARTYMNGSYAARPNDPGFRQIFSETLKFMAHDGGALLIHCAAGKDRTGTLAAIIQSALGVDRTTIFEDYMLTMTAIDIESFLVPAAAMMKQRHGRDYSPEALRPMFGVEPSYLENSLKTIGDMDSYISNTLGITSKERDAIHENYLI